MKVYHRLAAGAALGAIVLTASTPATAKPKNHTAARKHTAAHKHPADARDSEIRELKSEIQALTARVDAQEAAQSQAAQAAQAAQAQATSALSQSQAAQVQVAQLAARPAPVPPPPPKAPAPGWWGSTSISGKAFLNVSNIHQTSTDQNGVKTDNAQNGTETELKRFYVGIDHKFNDVFSANITTDFRYNANGTSKDTLVYVKKAYVQAKLNPAFTVRIGVADLPWIPFVEGLYGYRFVENTLIDRTKFGTSSDWGVHVLGAFGNGLVTYQVSAIDGAGYKTLSRSSDTIDLEGRISVNPIKQITLAVGGYTGKLSKSAANLPDSATPHTASRIDAVAAYTDKRIRAGVEYFAAKNWNNITTVATDKSAGWSAFGSFAFTPKMALFGRYDWVKPSRDQNPDLKDHYFNVGLDYKPIQPLDLALVYKHERTNKGFINTSNGNIGGLDYGDYDEVGLFGQIAF
jgi:multidrug efflux pump subunit AcrA (membrane-fusion protein)